MVDTWKSASGLDFESQDEEAIIQAGALTMGPQEVGLILLVLMLWIGAVALFFNRWGKIRMLEPYQPKFNDASKLSLGNAVIIGNPTSGHRSRSLSDVGCQCGSNAAYIKQYVVTDAPPSFGLVSNSELGGAGRRSLPTRQAGRRSLRYNQRDSRDLYQLGVNRRRQNSVVVVATSHFLTAARRAKSALDLKSATFMDAADPTRQAQIAVTNV